MGANLAHKKSILPQILKTHGMWHAWRTTDLCRPASEVRTRRLFTDYWLTYDELRCVERNDGRADPDRMDHGTHLSLHIELVVSL